MPAEKPADSWIVTEFEIIRTYFATQPVRRADVHLGIGDDAAVVQAPPSMETVVTTDVLVAGVHFFDDVDPAALGHKSLAVNLSDLAAMGAAPAWFLLDLTMPKVDKAWLDAFAGGLHELAQVYQVQLIGGDTSSGPLAVAIAALGLVPQGKSMRRDGAHVGDVIYVTGALGDAALALAARRGEHGIAPNDVAAARQRLERPDPRIAEGMGLRDFASGAIDISDGLIADLGHVLEASKVGARVNLGAIPVSAIYRAQMRKIGLDYALAGGDDYELCVTVPPANASRAEAFALASGFALTRIGEVTTGNVLEIVDSMGRPYQPKRKGHEHFARE